MIKTNFPSPSNRDSFFLWLSTCNSNLTGNWKHKEINMLHINHQAKYNRPRNKVNYMCALQIVN